MHLKTYAQPVPRLRHIEVGQRVRLKHDVRLFIVTARDDHYAYLTYNGGVITASLCHPIDIAPLDVSAWLRERFGAREEIAA